MSLNQYLYLIKGSTKRGLKVDLLRSMNRAKIGVKVRWARVQQVHMVMGQRLGRNSHRRGTGRGGDARNWGWKAAGKALQALQSGLVAAHGSRAGGIIRENHAVDRVVGQIVDLSVNLIGVIARPAIEKKS